METIIAQRFQESTNKKNTPIIVLTPHLQKKVN